MSRYRKLPGKRLTKESKARKLDCGCIIAPAKMGWYTPFRCPEHQAEFDKDWENTPRSQKILWRTFFGIWMGIPILLALALVGYLIFYGLYFIIKALF